MRQLIANADDFGWSDHTVEATKQCFAAGVLSSATLMVNRPGFPQAAAYARQHPEFSYGLHICLVDERPISPVASIPSLVGSNGLLHRTPQFFLRAALGLIRWQDICREVRAQTACMQVTGLQPSHFDSHGHMHRVPVVIRALLYLADETGVKAVRGAQDIFVQPRLTMIRSLYNRRVTNALRRQYMTPDHFFMVTGCSRLAASNWWRHALESLPEGTTEIGYHPGFQEEEWRTLETRAVMLGGRECIDAAGIRVINYKEFSVASCPDGA